MKDLYSKRAFLSEDPASAEVINTSLSDNKPNGTGHWALLALHSGGKKMFLHGKWIRDRASQEAELKYLNTLKSQVEELMNEVRKLKFDEKEGDQKDPLE